MAKKSILPRVHVMVVCDDIEVRTDETDLFNLRGVRAQILADVFPYRHPRLCVYLQVTGHEGVADGVLQVVRARTDEVLRTYVIKAIEFLGPTVIVPVQVRLKDCEFPGPGVG
jgi:hypothetical protein